MKLTKQMPPVSLVNETPRMTIISAVYNGSKTLQHCIDSVVNQTYSNKEIIIIDGGSKDGTLDIIRRNESRISYWNSEPDKGIYDAINKGIAKATGEVVAVLNSDDFYAHPEVLSCVAKEFSEKKTDTVFGELVYVKPGEEEKVTVAGVGSISRPSAPAPMRPAWPLR